MSNSHSNGTGIWPLMATVKGAIALAMLYSAVSYLLNLAALVLFACLISQIEAAARTAHCHDFISRLPRGYDTQIGELGGKLSGGERQRISIVRALLKDAPIVLLDEPTAALDSESERMVQKAISALARGCTLLIIAHRLSTLVAADQIVVMEQGRIVEQGTHSQLLDQEGLYHRLWHAQQRVKEWHFV